MRQTFLYNGLAWEQKHPKADIEMLGFLPQFFDLHDPRSAKEQADTNYQHGGGWHKFDGFTMLDNVIVYANDPEMHLLYETKLRNEIIRVYELAWVAIIQPDNSYEIARMD